LGRYELITQIGQGGMAEVQLALQRGPAGFEKLVVVKLVHESLATQKPFVDMLLDEARMAALVKHPNVVDIYDLGQSEGRYFIAMEYLEGEPLLAVLRAGRDGNRLDPLSTARLIADTAEGLDAAHELRSISGDRIELVHHDVSLGNIVVLYTGQVKLVDFGVAKATMSSAAPTRVQGKFSYMAPEKLRGDAGDRRSDIWSLGVVLWEALTLRRLFKGGNDTDTMRQVLELELPSPSAVNGDVPADFDPVVMRALERDPALRYATAKELARDLEAVLRTHGYAARNDEIARYMTETFAAHIVARKKLLQEVTSKGRASAAVIEAAFEAVPQTMRLSGEFSVRLPRSGLPAEGTPSQGAEVEAISTARPTTPEASQAGARSRLVLAVAGIVGAVLVVVVLLAARDGGERLAAAPATDPMPQVAPDVAPLTVAVDAAPVVEVVTEITTDTTETTDPPDDRRPRPHPVVKKPSAAELHRAGLKEFVAGDYRGALATLRRAEQEGPRDAPTWRTLGMVHAKLGQRSAAKAAFQRYLTLAPSAPDAATIRSRMELL
jgi:hypothetical protein